MKSGLVVQGTDTFGCSEEEREALRATVEAGGMAAGDGAGAGFGRSAVVLDPLVELLTQRAAE